MIVKQVSVFLENKSGRLNEVTQILGDAGINISAFTVADTSDFGVLRLIASDPDKACETLREKQFSVRTTDVILVKTANRPGALSQLLKVLHAEGAFIRPTNMEKCSQILERHKGEFRGNSSK